MFEDYILEQRKAIRRNSCRKWAIIQYQNKKKEMLQSVCCEDLNEDEEAPFAVPPFHSLTKACKFIEDLNKLESLPNYSTTPNPKVTNAEDQTDQPFLLNHSDGVMFRKKYSPESDYNRIDRNLGVSVSRVRYSMKENKRKKLSIQKKLSDAYPLDGDGFTKLEDGKVVFGKWSKGRLVSNAKIVYPSAHIYIGEVKDYQRHGKGIMTLKNGQKYVGGFVDGKYEGFGTIYNQNGEKEMEGTWRAGMLVKRAF